MKKKLLVALFLMPFCSYSQFSDHFSDGKFTSVPAQTRAVNWTGDVEKFKVNEDFQLQLNAPKETGIAQLRTVSHQVGNSCWEFWMKMNFSPTSSNYAKVYLCSDRDDLTADLNGLYLRIGYTNKNICLISKTEGTEKTLITGTVKRLDGNSVELHIRVTLDKKGNMNLYSKLNSEEEYLPEGNCVLSKVPASAYFGLVCYYTSTRYNAFYFDDFVVRELREDEQQKEDDGKEEPVDTDQPEYQDVVINEILFNPYTGGEEYIELYNRSEKPVDLRYMSIATRKSDGSLNTRYPLSADRNLLYPREYLVVTKNRLAVCSFYSCRESSLFAELKVTPALNNTGACIVLLNNQDQMITDEVCYTDKMHTEGISNKRGVSLERISPEKPSDDPANWHSASAETNYGTPGYENSQHEIENPREKTANEIRVVSPNGINGDDYGIYYRFVSPGNRLSIYLYDIQGRLIRMLANNQLLGTEGNLPWDGRGGSGQTLRTGVYIVYAEVYDVKGNVKRYKLPVVKR